MKPFEDALTLDQQACVKRLVEHVVANGFLPKPITQSRLDARVRTQTGASLRSQMFRVARRESTSLFEVFRRRRRSLRFSMMRSSATSKKPTFDMPGVFLVASDALRPSAISLSIPTARRSFVVTANLSKPRFPQAMQLVGFLRR
ncbi:MAG: hypothetical protein MZU97_17070 [Bacillus subtilis]|nr:hypothetical protein [Bacillus subtilis]